MLHLVRPAGTTVALQTGNQKEFARRVNGLGQTAFDWYHPIRVAKSDDTLPLKVRFLWEGDEREYLFEISENRSFVVSHKIRTNVCELELDNLKGNTQYFWRVNGSSPADFRTEDLFPRWLSVDGISNVRDGGGYRTEDGRRIRQGMIYRGTELNFHHTITEFGKRTMKKDLGVRTDLDLRGEAKDRVRESPLGPDVRFCLIPTEAYADFLSEEHKATVKALFDVLSDESSYPIYYHCWGGADRTGTLAFALGCVLGMNETDLFADYELTSLSIWGDRDRTGELFVGFLEALDQFGNGETSLTEKMRLGLLECGVSETQQEKIRSILLTEEKE